MYDYTMPDATNIITAAVHSGTVSEGSNPCSPLPEDTGRLLGFTPKKRSYITREERMAEVTFAIPKRNKGSNT